MHNQVGRHDQNQQTGNHDRMTTQVVPNRSAIWLTMCGFEQHESCAKKKEMQAERTNGSTGPSSNMQQSTISTDRMMITEAGIPGSC